MPTHVVLLWSGPVHVRPEHQAPPPGGPARDLLIPYLWRLGQSLAHSWDPAFVLYLLTKLARRIQFAGKRCAPCGRSRRDPSGASFL